MDQERLTRLVPIPGTPPSLIRVPSGCPFHPRCRYTGLVGGRRCETEVPPLREMVTGGHASACHLTADDRRREAERAGREDPLACLGKLFAVESMDRDTFSKLARYEGGIERALFRSLHELQRLQATRSGQPIAPPVALDVQVTGSLPDHAS